MKNIECVHSKCAYRKWLSNKIKSDADKTEKTGNKKLKESKNRE